MHLALNFHQSLSIIEQQLMVEILNLEGKTMMEFAQNEPIKEVDISDFQNGLYLIKITIPQKDTTTGKIPINYLPNTDESDFLVIYPNPSNGEFQIECSENINMIIIYSLKGDKVLDLSSINSTKYSVNLNFESGNYMIQITTNSNRIISKPLIIL